MACTNIHDVGQKFDMVFDFLSGIQSQLASIDSKLSLLQHDVAAMREDLRRLAGKPVEQCYDEWRLQQLTAMGGLQREPFVEPRVCGPGSKGDFKPDSKDNREEGLMEAFRSFMASKPNEDGVYWQTMLLSGEAGSGKSTCGGQLAQYVLTEYTQQRLLEGVKVIFLPINLPAVQDSVGSLFEQGAMREYGLRQTQVDQLRSLLQENDGKYEFIMALDGNDEQDAAKAEKNLYVSNNLWNLKPHKIVVSCRSESFARFKSVEEYHRFFYPLEPSNAKKDEEKEAKNFFTEKVNFNLCFLFIWLMFLCFMFLTSLMQRLMNNAVTWNKYSEQHVALQLRDHFARTFPAILTEPRGRLQPDKLFDAVGLFAKTVYEVSTTKEAADEQLRGAFVGALTDWQAKLKKAGFDNPAAEAYAALATTAQLTVSEHFEPVRALASRAKSEVWTLGKYEAAFSEVPELAELTATPFMLKVGTCTL